MSILINQCEKDFLTRRGYKVSKVYDIVKVETPKGTRSISTPVMFGLSKNHIKSIEFNGDFEGHTKAFEFYYDNLTPKRDIPGEWIRQSFIDTMIK